MMANEVRLIGCRSCDSKNCSGCNLLTLEEMLHKGYFDCLMDESKSIVANGVTFATDTNNGGKWISVEDKLPVDVKPVLAYYGFRNGDSVDPRTRFTGPLSYFGDAPNPHWQHESTGLVVTHWMPLPEPPKEE